MKIHVKEKHVSQLVPCLQDDETLTSISELSKHREQNKGDDSPANKDIVYCAM